MSGKKQIAKAKKEKAKLYRKCRGVWFPVPGTRVLQNKKRQVKPDFDNDSEST